MQTCVNLYMGLVIIDTFSISVWEVVIKKTPLLVTGLRINTLAAFDGACELEGRRLISLYSQACSQTPCYSLPSARITIVSSHSWPKVFVSKSIAHRTRKLNKKSTTALCRKADLNLGLVVRCCLKSQNKKVHI